jgi:anti-sigma regulatory factor (Ser/Thr protein kinase)
MTALREFTNTPAAIAAARRFVAAELSGVSDDLADDIAVMTSELVTNCVRHTVTDFTVRVERTGREVRVEVTDSGGGFPIVRSPDTTEPSGRGLRIVQELSDAFGIQELSDSPGKTVWFAVSLEERSSARRRDGLARWRAG